MIRIRSRIRMYSNKIRIRIFPKGRIRNLNLEKFAGYPVLYKLLTWSRCYAEGRLPGSSWIEAGYPMKICRTRTRTGYPVI